jgi:hypothetical protein
LARERKGAQLSQVFKLYRLTKELTLFVDHSTTIALREGHGGESFFILQGGEARVYL